jgi:hypothetical protein
LERIHPDIETAFAELPVNKLDAQAAEPSGYAEELCGFLWRVIFAG